MRDLRDADRRRHRADHPRHGRGRRPGRPDRRDEGRPDRRDGHRRRRSSPRRQHAYTQQLLDAVPHLGAVSGRGAHRESRTTARRPAPTRRPTTRGVDPRRPRTSSSSTRSAAASRSSGRSTTSRLTLRRGRGRRPGRRVRLGQDHDRPRRRRAAAGRRAAASRSPASEHGRAPARKDLRAAARAGRHRLPGPGLVAEPAASRSVSRSASRCCLHRKASRARSCSSGSRSCSTRSSCRGPSATATRTSSPAVSGSGSASPGRSRSSPQLLVADEPTSALDVSVQATVLDLFQELQREHGFACLFISHDLAVVEMLADRIAVMHTARSSSRGDRDEILRNPQDAYTQRLLAAVPVPDPVAQQERRLTRDALLDAARRARAGRDRAGRRADGRVGERRPRRARHRRPGSRGHTTGRGF